jgi:hypothetical protein
MLPLDFAVVPSHHKKQKSVWSTSVMLLEQLLEKLFEGVLRVLTPLGPRYIKPSFAQRLLLLWIFRHFQVLPMQVLSTWQRRLVESLCARQRFVSLTQPDGHDAPVLGTVERRPRVEVETAAAKPSVRAASVPFGADVQQRP